MAKGFKKIGDNGIHTTGNIQEIVNRFNAEIRKMNSPYYKKLEADKRKTASKEKKK